jgi:hypothetical protein
MKREGSLASREARLVPAWYELHKDEFMNNTLAWDVSGNWDPTECIDICPDTVYEDSVKCVTDPLSA